MSTEATFLEDSVATSSVRSRGVVADVVALAKPRITLLVLITSLGGMFAAPVALPWTTVLFTAIGTILIVAGANALNMYIERDSDRFMTRTANRPLPSGRMSPRVALAFGVAWSVLAVPVLMLSSNLVTTLLAIAANASYVFFYTPMKARSWIAVIIGAVPGAIPPLLGWSAATGTIGLRGASLFAILFLWQIPHFHAIALFRKDEYARAGLKVLPNVHGDLAAKRHIVFSTAILVAISFAPHALGMVTRNYILAVGLLGTAFLAWAIAGLRREAGARWARSFFGVSMPYLVGVFAAILATRIG